MLKHFLDIINNIGNNLDPIEFHIDRTKFDNPQMNIKIELGEIILANAHKTLHESLKQAYLPIDRYLESFQNEFYGLQAEQVQRDLDEFLSEDRSFWGTETKGYFQAIEKYQMYISKLKLLVQKEYFNEAIISQSDAIGSLKTIGERCIQQITDEIVKKHKKEIRGICDEYEEIKRRALEIPKSTENLFETGEYLLQVKKTTVDELGERIRETLRVTGQIVELTEMDEEHQNIQLEVVNWCKNFSSTFFFEN